MNTSPPVAFEDALAELERILRSLEDGATSLEDSLSKYERGVGLLKQCYGQLRTAEQRIQLVSGLDPDGKPQLQTFEHGPATEVSRSSEKQRTSKKSKDPDTLY